MISIVVPVFNEETRVKNNLELINSYLNRKRIRHEIIVVNDGSTDSTTEILSSLEKNLPFKTISHQKNLGKGAAIKSGVNQAKGELILFTDVDLSVPIEFISTYLRELTKNTDVIIGTRESQKSRVELRQFWLREFMGEMFTILTNLILGVGVSDFTCGFKLFRREAAKKIFNKQIINRWAFDAETLYLAKKYNFLIKEVPVVWRHRSGSKVKFPKDLIETIVDLVRIRLYSYEIY